MSTPSTQTTMPTPPFIPAPVPSVTLDVSHLLAIQCPLPGQPGAPFFDGKEATRFVRTWERFSEKYRFSTEKMVEEIVDYCEPGVGKYVETLIEAMAKEDRGGLNFLATTPRVAPWSSVRKTLLKKFKSDDSDQQRNSVSFLNALAADKPLRKSAEEVERYIYSFQEISNTLVAEEWLNAYDQMNCFLRGLPEKISVEVFKELKLDIDDPRTFTKNGGFTAGVKLALTLNRNEARVNRWKGAGIITEHSHGDQRQTSAISGEQPAAEKGLPTRILRNPANAQADGGSRASNGSEPVADRVAELEKEMEKMRIFQQSAMVPLNTQAYGRGQQYGQ